MNRRPERYNAKARQSVAGSSHKKGKVRNKKHDDEASKDSPVNTNAEILEHKCVEEKELDRKEKMKQELLAQSQSKASSKKKKRLEKYISSSTLGTGKLFTSQARLEKLEDKDVRRALASRHGRRNRGDKFTGVAISDEGNSDELGIGGGEAMEVDEGAEGQDGDIADESLQPGPVTIVDSSFIPTTVAPESKHPAAVGSALQRSTDGSAVAPRILPKREKRQRTILKKWRKGLPAAAKAASADENSESSFDSSDSAYDSEDKQDKESERGSGYEDESESDGSASSSEAEEESWGGGQQPASIVAVESDSAPPPRKKRKTEPDLGGMRGPLGEDLRLPSTSLAQHLQSTGKGESAAKKVVLVTRPVDVEEARLLLPIVAEEQPIMEAVLLNPVVIICGETGSGKTTQVPQFLYEAGFASPGSDNPGMIGVTQPRRVAAMSMASRIAHELSLTSSRVSYQIRYDATVSPSTSIKFMTDGVLLRELATDFLLTKYSVIIIDEAHERSMNTDILIGVLSRVIKLREDMWKTEKGSVKPLRLIIMSATLRVSDFAENKTLFETPPPIINVPARQHPVTIHFSRRTVSDYVIEAVRKTSKIHSHLPPGGILIFLTGQNEIVGVCRKLEAKYGPKALEDRKRRRKVTQERMDAQNFFRDEGDVLTVKPSRADVEAEDVDLGSGRGDDLALSVDGQQTDEADLDTDDDEADEQALGINTEESEEPMYIVPLYSLLSNEKQMRVFQPPPPGHRLVVVSTNVAETSLTIPGIRYVVDCGRAKERRYNVANGIQAFQISWISKASAAQRAGRAGRTGPGHCYRLYSSAVFENYFDQFSQPEILRMPIEGVVLQMKSMHIDAVVNFPFPTPPDRATLRKAETVLTHLGALTATSTPTKDSSEIYAGTVGGKITELGRTMSLFPLSPRFSKMLVSGRQHGCLPYVVAIVSAMSVGDPFLREEALDGDQNSGGESNDDLSHISSDQIRAKEVRKLHRRAYFRSQQHHASLGNSSSDLFKVLSVVGAYEYAPDFDSSVLKLTFIEAMEEIHKLRVQISNIVQTNFLDIDAGFVPNLSPPSDLQLKVLRQLLAAGFIDQVAVRNDLIRKDAASGNQYATASGVPYQAMGIEEDVYIHPSSVLATVSPPDFIVFHEVVRTSRVWLKGCTVINAAWLSSLGQPSLCSFSKPIKNGAGDLMVIPKFGPAGWELPPVKENTRI
ncbi:hypothetical protein EW146_g7588 [Bondarzewia mesenterica]|uniref:RNA helicase n=1 Tax=Bondarzewia mesenterica TaxID=1095465 RepID=A0A4V6S1C9_9AGAM|nr:hypothetical protein EW146_g7588 [Bondarzewia mesenterica]